MENQYLGFGVLGMKDAELTPESQARIEEIQTICNNLFYSDYYASGGRLKSKEEIVAHIKYHLIQTLTNFYGSKYAEYIEGRINNCNIEFVYQSVGDKSSIENYLKRMQKRHFKKLSGAESPKPVREFMEYVNGTFGGDIKKIIKNKKVFLANRRVKECLQIAGLDETIFNDKSGKVVEDFISRISQLEKLSYEFSDIPEVNSDMHKLQDYIDDYYVDAELNFPREIKKSKIDARMWTSLACRNFDIFGTNSIQNGGELILTKMTTSAFYDSDNTIYLGNTANDSTIIHEADHLITACGFQKDHIPVLPNEGLYASSVIMRKYEIFDEVIVELFASMMNQMNSDKSTPIINYTNVEKPYALYSMFFKTMKPFLKAFFVDLKEAQMSDDPVEYLSQIIGKEELDIIASTLNEMYGIFSSDLDEEIKKQLIKQEVPILSKKCIDTIKSVIQKRLVQLQSQTNVNESSTTNSNNYDHM